MQQITALTGKQATNSTGAIVHWRLRESVPHEPLTEAVEATKHLAALTGAPATPSPEVALTRAMGSVREHKLLARRIKTATWGIVRESVDKAAEKLSHAHELTVAVDSAGMVRASDPSHELCAVVLAAYNTALNELTSFDLSQWLTHVMDKLGAVSMRSGGGIYYVPPAHLAVVRELRTVLAAVGAKLYEIPAVATDDVVANVLDGLSDEVSTVADEVLRGVGDVGPRALVTRKSKLSALAEKIAKYEALLGEALPMLHARASKASAALVAAEMMSA